MKKKICLISILLIAVILEGCANQRTWMYKTEPLKSTPHIINQSVTVPPLKDDRSNENSNYAMIYMLPLMPFGWQNLNTPEGIQMHCNSGIWFFKPSEDIAKAVAEELNNTQIFKEVFYTNRQSEGDLVLKGTIKTLSYHGKLFSYGLSVFGPDLWFIGFPATNVKNELSLSFQLVDQKNNKILWEGSYTKDTSDLSWIYHLNPDMNYDILLKDILINNVIPSMKSELSQTKQD